MIQWEDEETDFDSFDIFDDEEEDEFIREISQCQGEVIMNFDSDRIDFSDIDLIYGQL